MRSWRGKRVAFDPASRIDLSQLGSGNLVPVMPIGDNVNSYRRNFDGFVTAAGSPGGYHSYLQVFRNGSVEAVRSSYFLGTADKIIPARYEIEIINALKRFLAAQQDLGVNPPLYIMLSLLDVRGYVIGGLGIGLGISVFPIEKQSLILPETELANFDDDITGVMKPVFDMVWNASGWPGSKNYNGNGKSQGLLTRVIGIITTYIAWQQWQTNRNKLKLDRYERRLQVYKEVVRFIGIAI